ncbi:uncharacterized protein ACLA_071610 [Aspergillus clavatus NRRL 1]|uniref:Uncharacterized protein n=1 Tax=Aspergillus clavatus (strain ATCC 1007 / CBS 513.65 / DSM 816 / NCTC 3887 / NRRL 1 / QM 1276 / 107) TaxID=344612 RepID=A1C6V7_ASPCL|nr:uncharacterized protein ACLA_071610 [Aspergillus clavatus NRRL 1]EAW14128.1 hypothetical protein ACLA_071610 [Aspergillus clavatus NRRL 1]
MAYKPMRQGEHNMRLVPWIPGLPGIAWKPSTMVQDVIVEDFVDDTTSETTICVSLTFLASLVLIAHEANLNDMKSHIK